MHQFLLGLHSNYYAHTRSTILAQDPQPSLNKAYQQVSQEELVSGLDRVREETTQAVGFALRTTAGTGRGRSSTVVCSYCQIPGHSSSRLRDALTLLGIRMVGMIKAKV